MGFRKGDKVKCIDINGLTSDYLKLGAIYTIESTFRKCCKLQETTDTEFYKSRFIFCKDITELIKDANKGLEAIKELKANHGIDCRCLFDNDTTLTLAFYNLPNSIELVKKDKKLMVTSNGWDCILTGNKIKIGCKEFTVKEVMEILKAFFLDEISFYKGYAARCRGIRDLNSDNVLSWKDAKTLYNVLVTELGEGTLIA